MASTSFTADLSSLQSCTCPQWFRDAKLGIWSHWGPQSVPRCGDWYARRMYLQGDAFYEHHVKTYGHPSKVGYKDIIPQWKAEQFDPDALMNLYVRAGAKYFVSMGVHHDNFDLWDSTHHRWNAVKMGPKRDIVAAWKAAAEKHGLPFGVSEHLGASYSWFSSSHGHDQTGPLAGVPYDGENPAYADLYHPSGPISKLQHTYEDIANEHWYTRDPQWAQIWFRRISDLIDRYQPDLLYSDGGLPFGEVGRAMVARLFNVNAAKHDGACQAVYNHKKIGSGEFFPNLSVTDVERGSIPGIQAKPWQCDTSLGDWYYSENFPYKTTAQTLHLLLDVVSKNGSMLLNVVQYPDGSLPPEPKRVLDEMATWMRINGEAIFGTRPWRTFGEGPTAMESGHFKETFPFTAQDIRFTTRGNVLYATTLGVPRDQTLIASLSNRAAAGRVKGVELLGLDRNLIWKQSEDALVINLRAQVPAEHAAVFRITLA
ncbi:alpha-L-fucosidase [soil metagenome]